MSRVDKTFLYGPTEGSSVVVREAERFLVRIGMGIEMDEGHRAVSFGDGPEFPEGDGMIPSQGYGNDPRVDNRLQPLFDHPVGFLDVAGHHSDVAVIDTGNEIEDIDPEDRVVPADHYGNIPDGRGTEPLPRAVAAARVERNPHDRDVHVFGRL